MFKESEKLREEKVDESPLTLGTTPMHRVYSQENGFISEGCIHRAMISSVSEGYIHREMISPVSAGYIQRELVSPVSAVSGCKKIDSPVITSLCKRVHPAVVEIDI